MKVRKVLSVALNVVLWATLAVALALMLFSVFANLSGGRKTLFNIGFYQIVSGSMEPEIKVGDVVIAKNAGIDDLKTGDNAVFVYGDKLVTHKVVEIHDGYIITKGVANTATERVAAADIVARQIFLLPRFGYAIDFMRSGWGFILIIALPLTGIIIWQSVTLSKRLKEYKAERAAETAEGENIKAEIAVLKARLNAENGAGSQGKESQVIDFKETEDKDPDKTEQIKRD